MVLKIRRRRSTQGLCIFINALVVAVWATQYLSAFLDTPQKVLPTSNSVYYSALFIRGLAVVTAVILALYLGWTYFDSRHTLRRQARSRYQTLRQQKALRWDVQRVRANRTHMKPKSRKLMFAAVGALFLMVSWISGSRIRYWAGRD